VRSGCVHLRISFGLNAARRLTFGPLGAWYGDTQLPCINDHIFPPLQTYELLTGRILFQPQPIEGLTADGCLLLLQHSLTGEVLDESIIERAQRKGQYFDSEGESQ
jgi:hypothetical protein